MQSVTAKVQEKFVSTVYKYMEENNCMLEGTLLKPSMTVSGVECTNKPNPAEVAAMTVQTLQRTIPPAMPGVTFLSGGISEEDASIYLNEINKIDRLGPWALTFSFSRAMQSSCIKIWGGKPENKERRRHSFSPGHRPTRRPPRENTSQDPNPVSRNLCTSRTIPTKREVVSHGIQCRFML